MHHWPDEGVEMREQLNVTILAVLAAKHEIARLKQKLASDDTRLEPVDDAELAVGWIIKRLREFEQSSDEESARCLVAATVGR
jgi:hypothetical protein